MKQTFIQLLHLVFRFLIFLLSKNMDSVLFKDFITKLAEKLKIDSPHLHPSA